MRYLNSPNKDILSWQLFENLSSARTFLKKNNIPENDGDFIQIKELLKNNPGYIFAFTKFRYKEQIKIEDLKYLYNLIKQLGRKIGELPQQIDKYESYEKVLDDIMRIEEHTRFNRIVAELPAKHKKEARENSDYFSLVTNMPNNVYKDYLHLMKTKSFSFTDFDDLYTATIAHIDSYTSMKQVVEQINETEGAVLTYHQGNIVVAEISTEEASKKLGSVSWCISSRGMWNHYNSPEKLTKQYFVWNFGVPYSSNDFRIGTTIKSDGTVHTSHLKDDKSTQLKGYCATYKIDIDIFKPISKEEAIQRLRSVPMTKDIFNKTVELDIWENLIDRIPFEWRLLRGLVVKTDKLTPIQEMIARGTIEDAIEFTNGDMVFEAEYQRYMFLNRFDLEELDNYDEILDKILEPLVYNNGKKIKYNVERKYFDTYINVEIPIEDYYSTMTTEYAAYVHRANYYGNTDDFFYGTEEEEYFSNYLSDEQNKRLVNIMTSIGIELKDDDKDKWYETLSKHGLKEYINDFMGELSSEAEGNLHDALKVEHGKLRFDYHEGRIEMGCENIVEYIANNFDKLNDYEIMTIIESEPNDTVDLPEYISMGEYITDDDIKKAGDSMLDKIEEYIDESDDLRETVANYKKFREMITKLEFEEYRDNITKETSDYLIRLTKFNSDDLTITGKITDKATDKAKVFKVPLDELPTYLTNHKLDLFFESLKSK
jgi:hypothetical protein